MTRVDVKKGEELEKALRKFKTKIKREGVIEEIKKREFYEKPSQRRRKQLEAAIRREVRRRKEADFE
jgi:small subunit ribosomal protein S21